MAQIIDRYGNPFDKSVLADPQTSRLGWVTREFANHPSRGLTPLKLHRILEDAEQGNLEAQADLFTDMEEKDGHIYAEMSKRKRALLTLDWRVEPARNASAAEKALAEEVNEWLQDLEGFEDLLLDALDGIGHGFAAQEIEWGQIGKLWYPQGFALRPQRWFSTLPHDGNALRLRNGTPEGEELLPFGWVVHTHKAKSGYLVRGGLHRVLAWPYLFKNYSVRDLAEFLEIYGLPLRIGKYTTGASDAEKATLLRAVTEIGHNAAGIIPQGMAIDFAAAAAGSHDPFEAMIAWCERTQSKAILGGTLTSQADGKSSTNALGNVHNEVRHDLLVSDARQLAGTLTRDLIWPWIAINKAGIDPRRCPRFEFDTREPEDLALYSEALPELVGLGMNIPLSWAHEKLNIPQAQGDEPVLSAARPDMMLPPELRAGQKTQDVKPKTAAASFQAALTGETDTAFPDQTALDSIALPADLLNAGMDKALAPVIAAIKHGADPEAAISGLAEAYPAIDDETLAELLARCLFVADIWGRVNGRD